MSGAVYRHIGGNTCYETIERGFADMERMIEYGRNEELSRMFNMCDNVEGGLDDPDVQMFFSVLSEFFSLMAQFDQ